MTMVCFVLFSQETPFDKDAWITEDTHHWPHGLRVSEITSEGTVVTFDFESTRADGQVPGSVMIGKMGAPAPLGDQGDLPGRSLWPEERKDELKNHGDHWVVTTAGSELKAVDQAWMVTHVVDGILRSHPSALGVIWGPDSLRIISGPFQEIARLPYEDSFPTMLWVATTIVPGTGEDAPMIAMTTGMEAFDLMEIESVGSPESAEELHSRLQMLIGYLLENGLVIKDGDTIGETASERIQVVYHDSLLGRDGKVMQLVYPESGGESGAAADDESESGCGIVSILVLLGLLVAIGLVIFGIVKVVGAIGRRLQGPPQLQPVAVVADPDEETPPRPLGNNTGDQVTVRPKPRNPSRNPAISQRPAVPRSVAAGNRGRVPANGPFSGDPQSGGNSASRPLPQGASQGKPQLPGEPELRSGFDPPNRGGFGPGAMGNRPPFSRPPFPARPRGFAPPPFGVPPQDPGIGTRRTIASPAERSAASLKVKSELFGLSAPATALGLSGDASVVAVATMNGAVSLQGLGTSSLNTTLPSQPRLGRITCVALDGEGQRLVGGTQRGRLRHWFVSPSGDVSEGMTELQSHDNAVVALALNAAGTLLLSLDRSGTLLWQRMPDESGADVASQSASVASGVVRATDLVFDEASRRAWMTDGRVVSEVDLRSRRVVTTPLSGRSGAHASLSADGELLVVCSGNRVIVSERESGKELHVATTMGLFSRVGITAKGKYFWAADDNQIRVWSVSDGALKFQSDPAFLPRPILAASRTTPHWAVGSSVSPEAVRVLAADE